MAQWLVEIIAGTKGWQAGVKKMPKEMADASKKSAAAVEGIGKAIAGICPQFAPVIDRVNKLGTGLGALGPTISIAALGAVGLGTAVVGATAAVVGLVRAGDDWATTVQEITGEEYVTAAQLSALVAANAALDGIGVAAKASGAILASEFAPAVRTIATGVVALELATVDWLRTTSQGEGVLHALAVAVVGVAVDILAGPVSALVRMIDTIGLIADLAGFDEMSAQITQLTSGYHDLKKSIAETTVSWWAGQAAIITTAASESDYWAQAEAMIGTIEQRALAIKEETKAVKEKTKAVEEETEAVEAEAQAEIDFAAIRASDIEARISAIASLSGSIGTIGSTITGAMQEGGLAQFRTQQAISVAQVGLLAPQAILQSVAQLGPIYGAIVGGSVVAAQIAAIAMAEPPSYAAGWGDYGGGAHLAMLHGTDSYPETVVPQAATREAGGPAGVRRRLEGGGATTARLYLGGREVAAAVAKAERTSPYDWRDVAGRVKVGRMSDRRAA